MFLKKKLFFPKITALKFLEITLLARNVTKECAERQHWWKVYRFFIPRLLTERIFQTISPKPYAFPLKNRNDSILIVKNKLFFNFMVADK